MSDTFPRSHFLGKNSRFVAGVVTRLVRVFIEATITQRKDHREVRCLKLIQDIKDFYDYRSESTETVENFVGIMNQKIHGNPHAKPKQLICKAEGSSFYIQNLPRTSYKM